MDLYKLLSFRVGRILYKRDDAIWDFLSTKSLTKGTLSGVSIFFSILEQNILLRSFSNYINTLTPIFNKETQDPWQRANHKVIQHLKLHTKTTRISDLLQLAIYTYNSERKWRIAKKKRNFDVVKESFKNLTEHVKQIAFSKKSLSPNDNKSLYSILVHERAPSIDIDMLGFELEKNLLFLDQLREKIKSRYNMSSHKRSPLHIPISTQEKIIESILDDMNLLDKIRLGKGPHPVCIGTNNNTGIVMSYHGDFIQTSLDFIHEIGHALARVYRLPETAKYIDGTPASGIHDSAIDECFALLWEDGIGRSTEWATYLEKKLHDFNINQQNFDADKIHKQLTYLSKDPVKRTSADEIQYLYHIALRIKLAKEIIDGNALKENSFPQLWEKYHVQIFGTQPTRGSLVECLQDFHWFAGQFGYFPSYAYGKFASCQIYENLWRNKNIDFKGIAQGNFDPTIQWLRKNLYEFPYSTDINELLIHATGEPLNTQYFRDHLSHRYYEIDRPHVRFLKRFFVPQSPKT